MGSPFMPPGGFAGFNQMTWASRSALTGRGSNTSGTGRRRRKRKGKAASRAKGSRRSARKMKFGSPAWQKKYKVGKHAKKRK